MGPATPVGRIGKNRGVAYTDMPFEELLDTIAAETPAPGGGSVAAFVTEMAASLAAMAARFAHDWEGAAGAVAQAETLRHRQLPHLILFELRDFGDVAGGRS